MTPQWSYRTCSTCQTIFDPAYRQLNCDSDNTYIGTGVTALDEQYEREGPPRQRRRRKATRGRYQSA